MYEHTRLRRLVQRTDKLSESRRSCLCQQISPKPQSECFRTQQQLSRASILTQSSVDLHWATVNRRPSVPELLDVGCRGYGRAIIRSPASVAPIHSSTEKLGASTMCKLGAFAGFERPCSRVHGRCCPLNPTVPSQGRVVIVPIYCNLCQLTI